MATSRRIYVTVLVSALFSCSSSGKDTPLGDASVRPSPGSEGGAANPESGAPNPADDAATPDGAADDGGIDTTRGDAGDVVASTVLQPDAASDPTNPDAAFDARFDASRAAPNVRWVGRVDTSDPTGPRFAWSGTGFVARFTGTSFGVTLDNTAPLVFKAVVDGAPQTAFTAGASRATYALATALPAGTHTVALYRQTEGVYGESHFDGVTVIGGALLDPPPASDRLIEAVGASVTCGYGDLGTDPCTFTIETESAWDTYAAIAARAVGAELNAVSISGRGVLRNGDGTTDGTMPKLYDHIFPNRATPTWDFHDAPQVVIINLGRNDFGVGDPGVAFRDAYVDFARTLRARRPSALILCTTGPNLGQPNHMLQVGYVQAAIDIRRAEGDDDIELVDWPEMAAGEIGCEFHPNAAKHQRMADQVVAAIRPKLGW